MLFESPNPNRRVGFCRVGRHSTGFTLVELLVVVVLIGIVVSLAVPAMFGVRSLAQRTACVGNLQDLGVAAQTYRTFRDEYPQGYRVDGNGKIVRWMDGLSKYLNKQSGVFLCPSDPERIVCEWDSDIYLSYGINTYNFKDNAHCFWYGVKSFSVRHPSRVIFLADCTPGKYFCGGGRKFAHPIANLDYRHLNDTFCALYCDGHAEARTTVTTQEDWDGAGE